MAACPLPAAAGQPVASPSPPSRHTHTQRARIHTHTLSLPPRIAAHAGGHPGPRAAGRAHQGAGPGRGAGDAAQRAQARAPVCLVFFGGRRAGQGRLTSGLQPAQGTKVWASRRRGRRDAVVRRVLSALERRSAPQPRQPDAQPAFQVAQARGQRPGRIRNDSKDPGARSGCVQQRSPALPWLFQGAWTHAAGSRGRVLCVGIVCTRHSALRLTPRPRPTPTQALQKRLIAKTEEAVEKDMLIQARGWTQLPTQNSPQHALRPLGEGPAPCVRGAKQPC